MEDSAAHEPEEQLSVRRFVAARIQEITTLTNALASTGGPSSKGLVFQHVPKHMRRRAVSHNAKRVPSRIRQAHLTQVEKSSGGVLKKPKKPSRKHRRRKGNLLSEYNRRQKGCKWLETHIWHAKRFHMKTMWCFKIPFAPCDKGYRAIYRAFTKYCAMRDMSYYSCLELLGPKTDICDKMENNFVAPDATDNLGNALHQHSIAQERSFHFYKAKEYPYGYIGYVSFFWVSENQLWLWVHPSFKEEVIAQLCQVFQLFKKTDKPGPIESSSSKSIDEIKLEPKLTIERRKWVNYSNEETFILNDLDGLLNRIRLCGPASTSVLKEMLQTTQFEELLSFSPSNDRKFWWQEFSKDRLEDLKSQNSVWDSICGSHMVPYRKVLSLCVRDPRIFLPEKRVKNQAFSNPKDLELKNSEIEVKFFSPLESADFRENLVKEKMTDSEYSKRRAGLLIPGSAISLGVAENQVPIILINKASQDIPLSISKNGGWDIILPAGWCMPFWLGLSYRAVRVGGLRDAEHFEFFTNFLNSSTFLPPDSASGAEKISIMENENKEEYFKLPPAKRPNLIKLGCPFPFSIQWKILLQYLSPSIIITNFFILRDSTHLSKIRKSFCKSKKPVRLSAFPNSSQCLVPVKLTIAQRGTIEKGAVICIPTEDDIKHFKHFNNVKNSPTFVDFYSEPPTEDINAQLREDLRSKHQKNLAFMRKKRKKIRTKNDPSIDSNLFNSALVSECYNDTMRKLWLPADPIEVLKRMSRVPMGFIEFGCETYSVGKCTGVGYCAYTGLQSFIQSNNGSNLVLVRNCRSSLVYRFAEINICCD